MPPNPRKHANPDEADDRSALLGSPESSSIYDPYEGDESPMETSFSSDHESTVPANIAATLPAPASIHTSALINIQALNSPPQDSRHILARPFISTRRAHNMHPRKVAQGMETKPEELQGMRDRSVPALAVAERQLAQRNAEAEEEPFERAAIQPPVEKPAPAFPQLGFTDQLAWAARTFRRTLCCGQMTPEQ